MAHYYDLVLAFIPLAFLGGTGLLNSLGLDLLTAVPIAALVAAAVICHAMFVRAPVRTTDRSRVAATE